jgi:uncharacterized protein YbbC (DUF1343 family)
MFRYRSHVAFPLLVIGLVFLAHTPSARRSPSQLPPPSDPHGRVHSGIDVLEEQHFDFLRGKRVGLITNQTGVDLQGRRTIDILAGATDVKLVALFSPEHGIGGALDSDVRDSIDARTHLPIYSLYGDTRRPTERMLKGIDVLVFDIQDAGVRFYTYVTTMAYCMEEAGKRRIEFVVLDRPNPLGGDVIEGPMLDPNRTSFTGYFSMPVRYGMTLGELAQMFNVENRIGVNLHVVNMRGWHRRETYDRTGLMWVAPSPNLRRVGAIIFYPGVEILQAGGVSVGRGELTPFEVVGAPWIRSSEFVAALNARRIPGVRFSASGFSPTEGIYTKQLCEGVRITVADRKAFRSMSMGLEIADVLHRMYPNDFRLEDIITLLGSQSTVDRLTRGDAPEDIVAGWSADLDKFRKMRAKYLLYD